MKLLAYVLSLILLTLAALGSTSQADVIVAEDFWYSQPTKGFGPGGGFGGQDYGGGRNGPAGQWDGRWVSFGDGIITGSDITEDAGFNLETDMFQAATRNGLSVNWLDRDYQLQGLADDQTVYFGVTMRSNSEAAMPDSRMIINDPGGDNQISMGFFTGGFVGSLGETEELLEGPGFTDGLDPHTLIGKLEINAIGSDERLTVWLDPTDVETAENMVQVNADVLTSVSDMMGALRLDHNFSGGLMFWDDVALGTAWEDVADVRVPRATLLVDTDSREARLVNTTEKDLDLTFYQITSESGALSDRTWESLADQGVEGWLENNPSGNSLTESRFEGSTSFADAARINLGRALRRRVEDLVARIGTADGLLNLMNVEYGEIIDPVMGDCNGDQVVDAADLTCICGSDTGTIADVLTATGLLAGDLDGDGTVAFPDFLVLSASFGQNVESYIAGDIDCDGQVAFADFLLLSANFGQSSGVMAAAVPEPSGLSLVLLGLVSLWHWRPT